jgi:GntR family transcriptional regulator
LDFRSAQPIYEQIISQYKYLTLQGYLKPGDAIPSVRKLAMELEITPGTVAKAYREMEKQGLIETLRGKGTFIAGMPDKIRDEGVIDKVKEELKIQCMELIYQGLDKQEIVRMIEEIVEGLQQKGENYVGD